MVNFKIKQRKFEGDLKISLRLYGKRLYLNESVKHLGANIDIYCSW